MLRSIDVRDCDITTLEVDAIANAANMHLLHGGGHDRAARCPRATSSTRRRCSPAARPATRRSAAPPPRRCASPTSSVALPAFGTRVGGFPLERAPELMMGAIRRHLAAGSGLAHITIAVRGERARLAFETVKSD